MQLHGPLRVARDGGHAQLVHQARCHVGRDAHVALAAAEHQRHGGGVVARIDAKACGRFADEPLRPVDVAGGFLDADDARHLRQPQHGFVLQIGHGAARHVVEQHGQIAARHVGDGAKVRVDAFLRGLVVVRHDLQLAVGAHFARVAGQGDGLGGGVGPAAGHDGHAAGHVLDRHADDFLLLIDGDRGRLARGADHADAVRAFGHMPVNQLAQRSEINAAVFMHGRDQRHDAALDGFHVSISARA